MQLKNMMNHLFSKTNILLIALAILPIFAGKTGAETIYEDFENLTLVDAEGNALASNWTPGAGLSNGWRVVEGTIYANDNGDYGLIHAAGQGFAYSDYYLTSASTSVNGAFVYIPERLQGSVTLWGRSNLNEKSKKTSTLKVYEATADGNVETAVLIYSTTLPKGSSNWLPYTFDIEGSEGKYIAINLVYTDIDDFTATKADGAEVEPVLTVSAEVLDFGTLTEEGSLSLTVKSNITTSVSFDITGSDQSAFRVVNAPATLPAGVEKTVEVTMNAPEPGDYRATLKITAGEQTQKVTLTGIWEGKTNDPAQGEPADWKGEDFSGMEEIPDNWTIGDDASWGIDDWWTDSAPALKGYSGFICTPRFNIGQDQTLEFYFQKGMSYNWGSSCTVYYSTNKNDWTEVEKYDQSAENGMKTIQFPAEGNYYLGLLVNATTYFDNFRIVGGKSATLSDVQAAIEAIANGQNGGTNDANNDGKTDIGDIVTIITNIK